MPRPDRRVPRSWLLNHMVKLNERTGRYYEAVVDSTTAILRAARENDSRLVHWWQVVKSK
jgi:hypothetical protein